MRELTLNELRKAIPGAKVEDCKKFLEPLNRAMEVYDINTRMRQAHFLAQIAYESGNLSAVTENLNYSAENLLKVFPKYFNQGNVHLYARNPEKIANRVYANRMGNGSEGSGDGWRFRGRGLIQVTGRENYWKYGIIVGEDMEKDGNWAKLSQAHYAADSAGWFWKAHHLNEKADKDEHTNITKAVNGSTRTAAKRLPWLRNAKLALGLLKK